MKANQIAICSLFTLLMSSLALAETRSVFLNGVDISSTKNQSLREVNVSIDARGNIYIEAPQYEAQQETTFVPLGRQGTVTARIPQHKAPGPLPTAQNPAQPVLAPEDDSRDTMDSIPKGKTPEGLQAKEGVRIPNNGGSSGNGGGSATQNPANNPGTR